MPVVGLYLRLIAHTLFVAARVTHGALPHRAPSTRCTADLVHHVWHRYNCTACAKYIHGRFLESVASFFTGCVHEWRGALAVS